MHKAVATCARAGLRWAATLRSLVRRSHGARIVTYHSVRPDSAAPRRAYVTPADLEVQVRAILAHGYRIVPLSHLVDRLQEGRPIPSHWVCITFDDGYADNYTYAFPVLKSLGVPATVFVVSGRVGQDPDFLTPDQIREMHSHGIAFGAHTVDHCSLSSCAPEIARTQIRQSKRDLEEWLQEPVEHFCYPYGHYNAATERMVREAGFTSCCLEHAGEISQGTDPLRLVRVGILGTDNLRDHLLKVQGAYDWWINIFMGLEERRRQARGGVPEWPLR